MFRSFSRDYVRLLAVAFLWGSATSQLSLFAVVLRHHGMTPPVIAAVLNCSTLAMIATPLIAGALANRFGAVRTIRLGALFSLLGIATLPFGVSLPAVAGLGMAGRGIGGGLGMPTGQLFAQAQAGEGESTRAVGMFSAMFLIPSFFGPALGEWSLGYWGEAGFFLLPVLPSAAALALVCWLPQTSTPAPPNTSGYLALVRDRRLWLPNLATMQSGLAYSFAFAFLPLLLIEGGIRVGLFFAPFAAALLLVRFLGLKYLQRLPPAVLVACGLFAYASGFYLLTAIGASGAFAPLCGLLFAFGYGVVMPSCITWATFYYTKAERARPVALANTSFSIGSIMAVQITGAGLNVIGWSGVLVILGTIIAAMCFILAGHAGRSRARHSAMRLTTG
jgi:MFS family permease